MGAVVMWHDNSQPSTTLSISIFQDQNVAKTCEKQVQSGVATHPTKNDGWYTAHPTSRRCQ